MEVVRGAFDSKRIFEAQALVEDADARFEGRRDDDIDGPIGHIQGIALDSERRSAFPAPGPSFDEPSPGVEFLDGRIEGVRHVEKSLPVHGRPDPHAQDVALGPAQGADFLQAERTRGIDSGSRPEKSEEKEEREDAQRGGAKSLRP